MNLYNLNITRIVGYICLTSIAIIGIIFGCHTAQKIFETKALLNYDEDWYEEK